MTDDELDEARDFLMSKKHLCRNFWSSQTDLDADIAAGNIWIAYAWAGSYAAAKDAARRRLQRAEGGAPRLELRLRAHGGHRELPPRPRVRRHLVERRVGRVDHQQLRLRPREHERDLATFPRTTSRSSTSTIPRPARPNAHYARPVSTERRAAYAQRWDEVKAA